MASEGKKFGWGRLTTAHEATGDARFGGARGSERREGHPLDPPRETAFAALVGRMAAAAVWRSLEVSFFAEASAPALAGELVRLACARSGLSYEASNEVELALVEAVNNAIEHAHRFDSQKSVVLRVEPSAAALTLEIIDDGLAMSRDAFERAAPTIAPRAAGDGAFPRRGMGLSIMKVAMDEVTYETRGDRNVLTMRKRIGPNRASVKGARKETR